MGLFTKQIKTPNVFKAVSIGKEIPKENFKGEIEKSEVKFPKELGDAHIVDMKLLEDTYQNFGFVTGVVDKYIDFIIGPGFYVTSDDDNAKKIIDDFNRDIGMDTLLRSWLKEAIIKGVGFIELGGSKNESVNGVKLRDAKYMYIKRDKKGTIEKYNQYIGGFDKFSIAKVIEFEPWQIIHFSINTTGNNSYGFGIIHPNLITLNNIASLEKDMNTLMKRKANVPFLFNVGDENNQPSPDNLQTLGQDLEYLNNKTEWVLPYNVKGSVLDFGKVGEKFDFPLNHNLQMLYSGFQVPEVLMGKGSIPEGLAEVQMDAFMFRTKSIQADFEKVIEEQIYSRVLKSNGINSHVEFEWGQPSPKEKNARLDRLSALLNSPYINNKMRNKIELEIGSLLGFKEAEIIMSDAEKKAELNRSQPIVPGSNQPTTKQKREEDNYLDYHIIENLEEFNTKPLKEWLNFNYIDYLDYIVRAVKEDKFDFLRGLSVSEIERGKLSDIQIMKLKQVLETGFRNGDSLIDISNGIKENVKPSNLYSEEGKLIATSETRNINIARTETTRLAAEGSLKQYKVNNIQEYSWAASISDRTCIICEGLNGKIFEIGKGPLPARDSHSGCRCTVLPVVR